MMAAIVLVMRARTARRLWVHRDGVSISLVRWEQPGDALSFFRIVSGGGEVGWGAP